jgi:hypothetical protein
VTRNDRAPGWARRTRGRRAARVSHVMSCRSEVDIQCAFFDDGSESSEILFDRRAYP